MVQSSYTIAYSPTPDREVFTETTGWAGAWLLGSQWAAGVTTSTGNPVYGAAAGFAGGVVGFTAGKEAGDAVIEVGKHMKVVLNQYNQTSKEDGCTICNLDH